MGLIQTKMTDFYDIKYTETVCYGYNDKTGSWHCLTCGVDMGINNPRQLCRKYFCENEYLNDDN